MEPTTFRLFAQCLNQLRNRYPKAINLPVFIIYMNQVKRQNFQFIVTFQESSLTNELLSKTGYTIIQYNCKTVDESQI
jgi:hypothetical protein